MRMHVVLSELTPRKRPADNSGVGTRRPYVLIVGASLVDAHIR